MGDLSLAVHREIAGALTKGSLDTVGYSDQVAHTLDAYKNNIRPLYVSPGNPGGEPRTGSSGPDEEYRASARIRGRRRKRVVNPKIAIHFKRDACKI